MSELQLRKQMLLLESDLNRLSLHASCHRLRDMADGVTGLRRAAGPWAMVLAPVAGVALALALRRRSWGGRDWLGKTIAMLPSVMEIWRKFSAPPGRSE